jgi:hypothetical protein
MNIQNQLAKALAVLVIIKDITEMDMPDNHRMELVKDHVNDKEIEEIISNLQS